MSRFFDGYGDKSTTYLPENRPLAKQEAQAMYEDFARKNAYENEDKNALAYYNDTDSRGVSEPEENRYHFGGTRAGGEGWVVDAAKRRDAAAGRANNQQAYADPGAAYQYNALSQYQNALNNPGQTMGQLAQRSNMNDAYAAQASGAASAMGGGANAAAAQRFAAMQSGQMAARGANDAAMLGVQERQQNLAAMGSLAGQARNSELNRAAYTGSREDAARANELAWQNQAADIEGKRVSGNVAFDQARMQMEEANRNRRHSSSLAYYGAPEKEGLGDKMLKVGAGVVGGAARALTGGLL